MNNRPDNFLGEAYYQNFEDAVRDVQLVGNNLPSKNKVPIGPKPHKNRTEPDIIKNTLKGKEKSVVNDNLISNSEQRQNIYANDGLVSFDSKKDR